MKPSTRSALILASFAITGIGLSILWVAKEARRVGNQGQTRRALQGPLGVDMAWIPAGKFTMGSNDGQPDEKPIHDVKIKGFWIDRYAVTNDQFAKFVDATHY
ncbi:MAG: SUMF1/EgtB/PvdO family nonheme iron enzyme, partial [Verrucomicrobiota bacterium]